MDLRAKSTMLDVLTVHFILLSKPVDPKIVMMICENQFAKIVNIFTIMVIWLKKDCSKCIVIVFKVVVRSGMVCKRDEMVGERCGEVVERGGMVGGLGGEVGERGGMVGGLGGEVGERCGEVVEGGVCGGNEVENDGNGVE